jgi:hypothetical protein
MGRAHRARGEQPRVIIYSTADHPVWENIARWTQMADWCEEHDGGRLKQHERAFVRDMARSCVNNGDPSEKQASWLQAIYTKLHRMEGERC